MRGNTARRTATLVGILAVGSASTPLVLRAQNQLANSGFETGTFAGWTVGGNSIATGVGADGTGISGEAPPFDPAFVNVRSGLFAAYSVTQCSFLGCAAPIEVFTLSQTVAVLPGSNYALGFYVGNDSPSNFGYSTGNPFMQIFVDGVGLLPSAGVVNGVVGSTSADFFLISSTFNSGASTSVLVTFQVSGSGNSRAGLSVDDFFVDGPGASAVVPEPSTVVLLGTALAALAIGARRRRAATPTTTA